MLSEVERIIDKETGVVVFEAHYQTGTLHRADGPAWVERDRFSAVVISECWYLNGELHRSGAAAVIERSHADGRVISSEIWLNGKKIENPLSPPTPGPQLG